MSLSQRVSWPSLWLIRVLSFSHSFACSTPLQNKSPKYSKDRYYCFWSGFIQGHSSSASLSPGDSSPVVSVLIMLTLVPWILTVLARSEQYLWRARLLGHPPPCLWIWRHRFLLPQLLLFLPTYTYILPASPLPCCMHTAKVTILKLYNGTSWELHALLQSPTA